MFHPIWQIQSCLELVLWHRLLRRQISLQRPLLIARLSKRVCLFLVFLSVVLHSWFFLPINRIEWVIPPNLFFFLFFSHLHSRFSFKLFGLVYSHKTLDDEYSKVLVVGLILVCYNPNITLDNLQESYFLSGSDIVVLRIIHCY